MLSCKVNTVAAKHHERKYFNKALIARIIRMKSSTANTMKTIKYTRIKIEGTKFTGSPPYKFFSCSISPSRRLHSIRNENCFYRGRGEKAPVIDAGDESPPPREREDRKKHVI
jgi:hypothetical protein